MRYPGFFVPLIAALVLCLFNAWKPLVIDDLGYLWYAQQIRSTPLEPFGPPPAGFPVIWYQESQGAFSLLTPMVGPYWQALGLSIFGDNLVRLKLWLFPICWLLTRCVFVLVRRFAPGWETRLTLLTVWSPAILPSLNLMVDVPALALALAAMVLFLQTTDRARGGWWLAVGAGLLAGLAAQTKYNGAVVCGAILVAGMVYHRKRWAVVAVVLAIGVFVGWEWYLNETYGQSHFLQQMEQRRWRPHQLPEKADRWDRMWGEIERTLEKKADLITPLIGNWGGLYVAVALLGLTAIRVPARIIGGGIGFVVLGWLMVALVPNSIAVLTVNEKGAEEITLLSLFLTVTGVTFLAMVVTVSAYLRFRGWNRWKPRRRYDPASRFLVWWLICEVVGYFVLTPFPAVRRLLMMGVVVNLLVGRLLTRTCRTPARNALANGVVTFGIILGFGVATLDWVDATFERTAIEESVEWIRAQPDGDTPIWFTGHWGFQAYAERMGLHPLFPDDVKIRSGDWLVIPSGERPYAQVIAIPDHAADVRLQKEWQFTLPLRTIPDFYCGYTPVRRHEGPRVGILIYRMR